MSDVEENEYAGHLSWQPAIKRNACSSWRAVCVLEELVEHAAGMKFDTTERRHEHCYRAETYDAERCQTFHVIRAA